LAVARPASSADDATGALTPQSRRTTSETERLPTGIQQLAPHPPRERLVPADLQKHARSVARACPPLAPRFAGAPFQPGVRRRKPARYSGWTVSVTPVDAAVRRITSMTALLGLP
jgi:hypothetical protein